MSLPDWVEDKIRQLAEDSLNEQAQAWRRIALIGELWAQWPPPPKGKKPSPEHTELVSLVASVARRKKASQAQYARLWSVLKQDPNGIHVPENIDWSTARCIVQHGGDHAVIARADREGWTLARARAWAMNLTIRITDKPVTVWRYLTRAVPKELRKSTELDDLNRVELRLAIEQALREFGRGE